MKAFALRAAKWVLYPLFYLFALAVCFYITFPWDRLKDRVVAEFAKSQAPKGDKAWRLEIGKMSGYWFSGVEIDDATITMPAGDDDDAPKSNPFAPPISRDDSDLADPAPGAATNPDMKDATDPAAKKDPPKLDSVVTITHAHARVEILPLLIGRVRVDFDAEAFGGEMKGTVPIGGGTLNVELVDVDLSKVAPLRDLVSVPVQGIANGSLEMTSDSGKWSKSSGSLDINVANVVLGDGKAKLLGKATLPPATLGNFEMAGKATDGVLKLDKFGATGKDVSIIGEGFLRVKDPWDASSLDFVVRFMFSDAYKVKDDKTIALFGDPKDPTSLGLLDLDKKMKKAKRDDGFYGFRGHGGLKHLKWDPTHDDGPSKPPAGASSSSLPGQSDGDSAPPDVRFPSTTPAPPSTGSRRHKHGSDDSPSPLLKNNNPGADTPEPTPTPTPTPDAPQTQPPPDAPPQPIPQAPPQPPQPQPQPPPDQVDPNAPQGPPPNEQPPPQ